MCDSMIRSLCLLTAVWVVASTPASAAPPKRPAPAAARRGEPGAPGLPKGPTVDVKAFGAVGDGMADDAPAFQRALDHAGKVPGTTVHVPAGNFVLKAPIVVPPQTALVGVWHAPTAGTKMKGSTLVASCGKGEEDGPPLITLGPDATLKGLTVYYPEQDNPDDIRPFPWCIRLAGDNISVLDCLLINPYKGIDAGTRSAGRHFISRVYGQPLRIGIFVDQCYDVGRIENVHFWPFWNWKENAPIHRWMLENSECFVFARTDWEYVYNTFCFGYGVGYRFVQSDKGACNGNFLGIGADATRRAVVVEHSQPYGLLITNGEFVSFGTPDAMEVDVAATNVGAVQFNNCAFWGPSDRIAVVRGGTTSFSQCHFFYWDHFKRGNPAIRAEGGRLIVNACRFAKDAPHISIGEPTKAATVVGNVFTGAIRIENGIGERAQIGLNAGDEPSLVGPPPPSPPGATSPATRPAER